MCKYLHLPVLFHIYFIVFSNIGTSATKLKNEDTSSVNEKKISEYVSVILEHYKQEDPIGIPGAPVPDPLNIPPLSHSFSVGKMHFENVELFGLSKFRIVHLKADLAAMQVDAALQIDVLNVLGNYTLSTWVSKSQGPFTVELSDVYIEAIAKLEIQRGGQLEAQEMNMDITFKNIAMNFERLGFFANVFQGMVNTVGAFIFDSIKPFILSEVNTNMRNDVNKQVRMIPQKFPNSISPFDQLIAEARHKVRNAGYDPYKLQDYNHTVGVFETKMTHTWLMGLSSFYRMGNMTFTVKNNTIHLRMEIGTQKLVGKTHWEVSVIGGFIVNAGVTSFTVDYLAVEIELSQSMNTHNHPQMKDLQLELGNIQVRCDGAGTLDYAVEFAVNILPNLLRYQILDAIEIPIKNRIQESLNNIDVDKIIHDNLSKLDDQEITSLTGFL